MKFNKIIIIFIIFFKLILPVSVLSEVKDDSFNSWLKSYKEFAYNEGISKKTITIAFQNVKF